MNDHQELRSILHGCLESVEEIKNEIARDDLEIDFDLVCDLAAEVELDFMRVRDLGVDYDRAPAPNIGTYLTQARELIRRIRVRELIRRNLVYTDDAGDVIKALGNMKVGDIKIDNVIPDQSLLTQVNVHISHIDMDHLSNIHMDHTSAIASAVAIARLKTDEAIQGLRSVLRSLDAIPPDHQASRGSKSPADEVALARAAKAERIVASFLDWADDANSEDVSGEVYLEARNSNGRRNVIKLTVRTCTDALRIGLRRRYGRYGRCFLEAIPSASLAALPYFITAAQHLGWVFPGSVFAVGGITLVLHVSISGLWNAYKEWKRPESESPRSNE
jgi:hypothetical protein